MLRHACRIPCFRFSAPRVWNSLPVSIRETKSIPTFRRHLKTHYFQSLCPYSSSLEYLSSTRPDFPKDLALYKPFTYLLTYCRTQLLYFFARVTTPLTVVQTGLLYVVSLFTLANELSISIVQFPMPYCNSQSACTRCIVIIRPYSQGRRQDFVFGYTYINFSFETVL